MSEEYVRVDRAAEIIGVSVNTLSYWRWTAQGPPYTKAGSRVLYGVDDLRQWMASRRVVPGGQEEASSGGG